MWGRSGEVYEPEEVDEKDPNYDEAQVLTVVLILYIFIIPAVFRIGHFMQSKAQPHNKHFSYGAHNL